AAHGVRGREGLGYRLAGGRDRVARRVLRSQGRESRGRSGEGMSTTAAVLGPGAVGGALAVRLANVGVQVVCVAHPEAVGLIALAGLVVESPEGTLTARVEVTEHLAKPVDLLLVTVKAPALEDAIERVDPSAVSDGVVVSLLNGLEHMDVLRARFDGRVAAGS